MLVWTDVWDRLRPSMPLGPPTAAIGVTFGLLASPLVGAAAAITMSAVVWSGTAQFATLSVLGGGGGMGVAGSTGLLANSRFLPMGFAIAPSVTGSALRRVAIGSTLVDASFAIAHQRDSTFDIRALVWAAPIQYLAWVIGTVVGATVSGAISEPTNFGLDVLFPVFYLGLLIPELAENHRAWVVAAVAGTITIATTPFLPAGLPVVLASLSALIGAKR